MTTQFDFTSIEDLGKFWDGSKNAKGSGGGNFNAYGTGLAGTNHNLDLLYQNLLGRNADSGGKKHWGDEILSGKSTYQSVADAIKASKEYTGQQDYLTDNPDATGDDLKNLGSAYIDPFHWGSGSVFANWDPTQKLTQEQAESATGGAYSDHTNTNVNQVVDDIFSKIGTGDNPFGGSMNVKPYDDSALKAQIASLTSAFDKYKTESAKNMQNMWNNANWGWGQTVGGVRTQNELPGWAPKKGGTSGFFGRGGRSGKGLTTSSLNI